MPSNPSNAQIKAVLDILQYYPELQWSDESLQNTRIFHNEKAVAVFSHPVLDEVELLLVATHPDSLKQGYAARLMQQSFKALQVKKVFLEVRESNFSARKLYEKLGFLPYNTRKNYYKDQETAVLYVKELIQARAQYSEKNHV